MFLLIWSRWKRALILTLVVLLVFINNLFNLLLIMQAAQIRDKYKRILEEPEEEDSDDEWEIAYSQMNKHRKKKILTEASINTTNGQINENSQGTLALKQKLAQCLSNCKGHCKEIERLKKEQMMFQQEKAEWKNEMNEFSKLVEEEKSNSKLYLQRIKGLENEIQEWQVRYQQVMVEKDLQLKQSEFYKAELGQLQVELQKREREFKQSEKEFKTFDRVKKDNEYLRADVERLSLIIEQSVRFGRVSGEIMKKHFLGKPHRQMDFWFPQQLVGEVEHFLKKSQVGNGNKQFTSNLIKFIEKLMEKSKEEKEKEKPRQSFSCSKQKQKDCLSLKRTNKLNMLDISCKKHTYNLSSMRDDHLLRSNTNSFWKCSESRVLPSCQNVSLASIKSQSWDIVNEFRSVVFELLLQKEVKRKKIKKLIDSMSNSLMELFQVQGLAQGNLREFSFSQQKKDAFCNLRLTTEDSTAPLK